MHALIFHFTCHTGMIALNWSIARRSGSQPQFPLTVGWMLATSVIVAAATLATDDAFYRLFAVELAVSVQFAIGIWSSKTADNSGSHVLSTIPAYWLPMLLLLVCPMMIYAYEGPVDPDRYSDSIQWLSVMLFAPLTIVILSTSILLALSEDLAERVKRAHQTDFLTGLPNRQAFEERAEKLFAEAGDAPISMILTDVDDFKQVNDTLGHHMGDAVLAAFGKLLHENLDAPHLVGRVGGEEFCIVLWQTNERTAKLLATQLCVQLASLQLPGCANDRRFTASFGVAERSGCEAQSSMYRNADRALYAAKRAGKNRVAVCSSLDDQVAHAANDEMQSQQAV